ncbi:MAG: hypothetical protein GXO48_07885 [Chlorobi bacterium]|nr:hypothetical protein [Chlorobiota bacterium]
MMLSGIGLYWKRSETASVHNRSPYPICGKRENSDDVILICPGEEYSGVDGVWVPWNPGCVFKIPNGVHVCIDENSERIPTLLSETAFRNLEGGWYKPERLRWEEFAQNAKQQYQMYILQNELPCKT